jgi:hypothetical protein
MKRSFALVLVSVVAFACSSEDPARGAAECETATAHVAACYGEEVGAAFAEACTADAAATALDEKCQSVEEGKADSFSTPILSPAIEHFKYGSIGSDKLGIPLVLLKAMPLVCAELLPPGADPRKEPLSAFGLIYEPGQDLPIGFSRRRLPLVGITLVGNTCSACHTSTVRETSGSARTTYFGAPAIRFDVERYNAFLLGCISDTSRFNATNLNAAFDELGVTGFDRVLAYKSSVFRAFVSGLKEQVESVVRDGAWGPGRDDAIGLSAAILLGEEHLPALPAPVDYPSVWNQKARQGQSLHWDGASGSASERNILVSVGAGTPKHGVPLESIAAIQSYIEKLAPPKYPFAVDTTLAAAGKPLFDQYCASCHATTGARLWEVIDLAEIGTDPNRVDVVTQDGIDAMNDLWGWGWECDQFEKTNGYVASLLDGIWLRAPYLHNGSVPTLRDLLNPAAERPTTFYRGNDTYDQNGVGFVSNLPGEGATSYTPIDTARQGNGNGGHEGPEYGTDLPDSDKEALLEYLKTL